MTTPNEALINTTHHLAIEVDMAIDMLKRGKNPFVQPVSNQMLRELTERRAKGIKYISGCGKETKDGKCRGHKQKSKFVV